MEISANKISLILFAYREITLEAFSALGTVGFPKNCSIFGFFLTTSLNAVNSDSTFSKDPAFENTNEI
jgi:hypothetical protein